MAIWRALKASIVKTVAPWQLRVERAQRQGGGTFEPQLVKKHQTQLTDEMERKIISLFSLGSSYQNIRTHIEDMYGMSVSNGTVNAIIDKLLPELQAWA
jgi:putative transposase